MNQADAVSARDIVFFSYRHHDGRWLPPLRNALEPYVLGRRLKVWSDQEIETGQRWRGEIQQQLARTRIGVLLISQNFFASEYIREHELPWLIADAQRGLLTLICVPVGDVDPDLLKEWQLDPIQFAFPCHQPLSARRGRQREKAIVEVAVCIKNAYRAFEPVAESVEKSQPTRLRMGLPLETLPQAAHSQGQLYNVPELDHRHIERPEALRQLKQAVLEGTTLAAGVTAARQGGHTGLHGMGGMGKTTLLQAFCRDVEVRSIFIDGIYWVTLGQSPDVLAEQTRLLKLLGEQPVIESSSHAKELLKNALAGKRILLVIDDLWQTEHFRPLDVVDGSGRILLTTRDASLLAQIGAREQLLEQLDEAQALSLLARYAGREVAVIPQVAKLIPKLCGYHLLAVALSGAQIADGVSWPTLVKQLEQGRLEFLDHDYGSVYASLGRSVDALSAVERSRYLELAVFPEDTRIPLSTLVLLWQHSGGMNAAQSEKLLARLDRKSLLKLERAAAAVEVTLHDLQRDFLRIRGENPVALGQLLLQAYRRAFNLESSARGWAQLPVDEPYLWPRLAQHLIDADRRDELHELLLDPQWMRARLTASVTNSVDRTAADVNALLSDYSHLQEKPAISLVQRALRMSSHVIGPHPEQVGLQLFGRLGAIGQPEFERINSDALRQQHTLLTPMRPALRPPGALIMTLAGHRDGVRGAVLLESGRRVLSWSWDRTLKLWDLERGEFLHTLGHESRVVGAVLLESGRRAMSWSEGRTLKLWDLERGELLHTLSGHGGSVSGAVLLESGRRALSWSWDGTLKLWDLERGELLHTLSGHGGSVSGAVLLESGRRALSWSEDWTLKLWDLERGELLHMLSGHENHVDGAVLLESGHSALSWSWDGTLKLWDLERGELLHTLSSHEDCVSGAVLLESGRRALSWSMDGTLKLWDLPRGELLHTLSGHGWGVAGAVLLESDRRALSWSEGRTLKLWDLERGELLHTLSGHEDRVSGAVLLASGRRALSWSRDRTLKLWDLERGELLHTLSGHGDSVYGAVLLESGRRTLSWSWDGTLKLWDLERGELLHTLSGHEDRVSGAVLLESGRRALSWSEDRTLKLWDLECGELLHALSGHKVRVYGAVLLESGRRVMSWSEGRTLKLWDLERGELLHTLSGHGGSVYGAVLLESGRRALSWSWDGTLKLWDLERGELLHTLSGHEDRVSGAVLLEAGRRALSWSEDRTLKLWDLERGELLHTLSGHVDRVSGAVLLESGRRALSWSWDGTLKLWELERGGLLHTLSYHEFGVDGAVVLESCRCTLSWSEGGTLKLWDLEHRELLHTLSGHEKGVRGAVLLESGHRALSWSWDRTLKLWDLERGELLHTLSGHENGVNGAVLLDSGRRALSWSEDRTLKLWDLGTGTLIASYYADASITAVAVDESAARIFAGDALGHIHLIRLGTS